MASITFSSCFYIIKSKFDAEIYCAWMNNLISIVNNFNLVIYTDEKSVVHIKTGDNPRIKIVIKPIEQFVGYQFKDYWIANHEKNTLLNKTTSWELNMLWSEKIAFVYETFQKQYFDTEFYGWCDIGYFRNTPQDTPISLLGSWPSAEKIAKLDKSKVYYACVMNNPQVIKNLFNIINNKNEHGLLTTEIPPDQKSIGGGFFIAHKTRVEWWQNIYYNKLIAYFKNNLLVKDDQIILADCIFSDLNSFYLYAENKPGIDNWFMFQRIIKGTTFPFEPSLKESL
jgi:hypothetical protein